MFIQTKKLLSLIGTGANPAVPPKSALRLSSSYTLQYTGIFNATPCASVILAAKTVFRPPSEVHSTKSLAPHSQQRRLSLAAFLSLTYSPSTVCAFIIQHMFLFVKRFFIFSHKKSKKVIFHKRLTIKGLFVYK